MWVRRLRDSIYQAGIIFVVSPIGELAPWLTRRGYPADGETEAYAAGKTLEYNPPDNRASIWFVWVPPEVTLETIAHECVHLAAQVLRDRDVTLNRASEEAYAYYVSAMFTQMQTALQHFRRTRLRPHANTHRRSKART